MNPWIGVTLIGIGISADVVLTLTHNQVSSLVVSVVVAGIGIVQSFAHARYRAGSTVPGHEYTNGHANGAGTPDA